MNHRNTFLHSYSRLLNSKEGSVLNEKTRLDYDLEDVGMRVGFYFVDQVMKEIAPNRTQKIGQSLLWLIENPPTKLDELKNPHTFVARRKGFID